MTGTQWKQEGIDITDSDAALQAQITSNAASSTTNATSIASLQADVATAQSDITTLQATSATKSDKIEFTPEGGLAVWLTNKTGAPTVKGYLVTAYDDSAIDNAFELVSVDAPDIIGAIYDAGIADGQLCRVVVAGIADVYFAGDTTRGHFARMTVAADTGDAPGVAISETKPTSPFATDKHFMEVGHVLQSRTGAGLARILMHFN